MRCCSPFIDTGHLKGIHDGDYVSVPQMTIPPWFIIPFGGEMCSRCRKFLADLVVESYFKVKDSDQNIKSKPSNNFFSCSSNPMIYGSSSVIHYGLVDNVPMLNIFGRIWGWSSMRVLPKAIFKDL